MQVDLWQLLGGVGLLIFGMSLLEHALYTIGWNKLKHYLQHHTASMRSALPIGMVATMLMWGSGDLVTLLVMAMYSAWLITFRSSLGIIFWSNIWATSLPLLISFFGFGSYAFSDIVLPMIAIGGVSLIITKSEKYEQIAKALIGFGLLFIAIEWMSDSITAQGFDIAQYKDASLRWFGLLGAILAMIIQSGGAIGIITLTALKEWIITFPASIAIMMGVNIGTTNTPFLGALWGKREKVQIAMSHVLFNVLSGIIGVLLFRQFIWIGHVWFDITHNEALSSAVINFIFNLSTALLFALAVSPFEHLVNRLIPTKTNGQILEIEELQKQVKSKEVIFSIPLAIAYRKDTRNFVREVIALTDLWINQRMLHELINEPIWDVSYQAEQTKVALEKAKKLLTIAIDVERQAKNAESMALLDQCKRAVRQCYHTLELILRTDVALQSETVSIPKNASWLHEDLATGLSTILNDIKRISNHEDAEPTKHLLHALHELKALRLRVLKALISNVSNDEKNDETLSELIIFTQRLYQIIKKLIAALDYSFLLKSEQEIIEHEIE